MTVTWLVRKDSSAEKRSVVGKVAGIMHPMLEGESFGVELDASEDRLEALRAMKSAAAKLKLGIKVEGAEGYDFVVTAVA
jgi:hypothetical protein